MPPKSIRIPRYCANCGKQFLILASIWRKGQGQCCSQHCAAAIRTNANLLAFWDRVEKTDACWLWTGPVESDGYGQIKMRGKSVKTHRLVYRWFYGSIPDGLYVCHTCDTPRCVNPAHLFPGTSLDNARDRAHKGRSSKARGEQIGGARLNVEQVIAIRARYTAGNVSQSQLAREFGVSQGSISLIVLGRNWKHVPLPD